MSSQPSGNSKGVLSKLVAMDCDERVAALLLRLRIGVAVALGMPREQVSPDTKLTDLSDAWRDPEIRINALHTMLSVVAEIRSWPPELEPIATLRELASHFAIELDRLRLPTSVVSDPRHESSWEWKLPDPPPTGSSKNRTAAFLICTPRSGSTLLSAMLNHHPDLYSPGELYLLPFGSLGERERQLSELGCGWMRDGLLSVFSELLELDSATAKQHYESLVDSDASVQEVYGLLQQRIGQRLLIDKTPNYASHPRWLQRGEELFSETKYIHLTRHPKSVIESLVRLRMQVVFKHHFGVWDENAWHFAEKLWTVQHANMLDFLAGIPNGRQLRVEYERLVREPASVLEQICEFLGVEYDERCLDPYGSKTPAGTFDPNFFRHRSIESSLADAWKDVATHELGEPSRAIAQQLGYTVV